jgi:quercetin dioxygenase-like cupin family protein
MSNDLPKQLIATIADSLQPMELSAERRDRMRDRVLQLARESTPAGTITVRSTAAEWLEIAPHVSMRELHRDESAGTHTSLMRMSAGGVIPPHRHSRDEVFVILEGECHIGTHLLCAGDVHAAKAGSTHAAITTRSHVLVLIRGEYPYPAGVAE